MSFLAEISIAFTAGLIAAGSPCVLPLYPGYLAYIVSMTQKQENHALRYTLGLSVLAGILTTLLVIGAILALLQLAISDAMSIAIPFAYATIFFLFGIGMGTPLILMSLLTDKYQLYIVRMVTRHFRVTEITSGVILILIGVYGFWTNWQFLSLYLR